MESSVRKFLKRKILLFFAFSVILTAVVVIVAQNKRGSISEPSSFSRSAPTIPKAISLASHYLEQACEPSGKFVYVVHLQSGKKSPKYNIIRHAGAMYALAAAYDYAPTQATADALARASNFLLKNYIAPAPISSDKTQFLAVWSAEVGAKAVPETTLGATGLGLVALVELKRIQPKAVSLGDLQAMGRFLLFLQKKDGSFYSKYAAKEDGRDDTWKSLYYPGETALGFLSLYELDSSKEWLHAAEKALLYLAKSRVNTEKVPPDCWALIATAKLFAISDRTGVPISREFLTHHAVQICERILGEQITNSSERELNGGFEPSGRTTPTATRLEGLLASLEFLPKEQKDLRLRIENATQQGIAFLIQAQISSGPYAGAIPGRIHRITAEGEEQPDPDTSKVRIDYVQHTLCALIHYQCLFGHVLSQGLEKQP